MVRPYSRLCRLYALEFFDSTACFLLDFVFILYLANEFSINDIASGWLYGIFGLLVIVYGLIFGCAIDYYGVESTLLFGSVMSFLGRLCLVNATTPADAVVTLLLLCPAATVFTNPVIKLALKRYTPHDTQDKAFRTLYIIINIASLTAGLLVHYSRNWMGKNCFSTSAGVLCKPSMWNVFPFFTASIQDFTRLALVFSVLFSILQIVIALSLFFSQGSLGFTNRGSSVSIREIYRTVFSSPELKNYLYLCTIIIIGVGCLSRHFGAIFPKYYARQFGSSASYELVLLLNPLIIIIFIPMCMVTKPWLDFSDTYYCLLIGTLISASSAFFLAVQSSVVACVTSVVAFTIGEAIWSPKLLELSVNFSSEGREGLMLAFSTFPKFLSRTFAGLISGYLLNLFCPADQNRHPNLLWTVLGLLSLCTPLLLLQFKEKIFPKIPNADNFSAQESCNNTPERVNRLEVDSCDEETESTVFSCLKPTKAV